jgi:hypothetical protein
LSLLLAYSYSTVTSPSGGVNLPPELVGKTLTIASPKNGVAELTDSNARIRVIDKDSREPIGGSGVIIQTRPQEPEPRRNPSALDQLIARLQENLPGEILDARLNEIRYENERQPVSVYGTYSPGFVGSLQTATANIVFSLRPGTPARPAERGFVGLSQWLGAVPSPATPDTRGFLRGLGDRMPVDAILSVGKPKVEPKPPSRRIVVDEPAPPELVGCEPGCPGCTCHLGHPPCHHCVEGHNLPKEDLADEESALSDMG